MRGTGTEVGAGSHRQATHRAAGAVCFPLFWEKTPSPPLQKKKKKKKGRKKGSEAVNEEASAAKDVESFIIFQHLFFPFTLFVFGRRRSLSPPAPAVRGADRSLLGAKNGPIKNESTKHSLILIPCVNISIYAGGNKFITLHTRMLKTWGPVECCH